jgi:hypothetical protein
MRKQPRMALSQHNNQRVECCNENPQTPHPERSRDTYSYNDNVDCPLKHNMGPKKIYPPITTNPFFLSNLSMVVRVLLTILAKNDRDEDT